MELQTKMDMEHGKVVKQVLKPRHVCIPQQTKNILGLGRIFIWLICVLFITHLFYKESKYLCLYFFFNFNPEKL